jgi:ABC-2 type transport system permease protein
MATASRIGYLGDRAAAGADAVLAPPPSTGAPRRCSAYAPVPHWTPVFHGSRKAVLWWLAFPVTVITGAIMSAILSSPAPMFIAAAALVMLPVYSLLPGVVKTWIPLSQPNQDQRDPGMGCLVMGGVVIAGMATSGIAAWAESHGYLWIVVLGAVLLSIVLQKTFVSMMRERVWYPDED